MRRFCAAARRALVVASVAGAVLASGASAVATGQSPAPATAPKLLSTTPTPPTGAVSEPSQMSGLPLQVGDLPPGTVAVRVIRRSFASNVANQMVELRVTASGRTLKAMTDSAGRAIFEGLALNDLVSTSAVVDGERLESQPFEMPAQGGVRLVLVAGVGAGIQGRGEETPAAAPPEPTVAAAQGSAAGDPGVPLFVLPLAILVVASAGIWWSRTQRQASSGAPSRVPIQRYEVEEAAHRPAGTPPYRESLFEALINLEHEHEAGRVESVTYAARREELISLVMEFDEATQRTP